MTQVSSQTQSERDTIFSSKRATILNCLLVIDRAYQLRREEDAEGNRFSINNKTNIGLHQKFHQLLS